MLDLLCYLNRANRKLFGDVGKKIKNKPYKDITLISGVDFLDICYNFVFETLDKYKY